MKKSNIRKLLISIIIVNLLFTIILVCRGMKRRSQTAPETKTQPLKFKGAPQAPVKIVVYSDFQCAACAAGYKVLREFQLKFPDKISVEFRHYPIEDIHPQSLRSAEYAECAALQGKFWPFYETLFLGQKQWSSPKDAERYFQGYAKAVGLDAGQLETCLQDESVKETIFRDRAIARFHGVSATPTYFINGKIAVGSETLRKTLNRYFFPESKGKREKEQPSP